MKSAGPRSRRWSRGWRKVLPRWMEAAGVDPFGVMERGEFKEFPSAVLAEDGGGADITLIIAEGGEDERGVDDFGISEGEVAAELFDVIACQRAGRSRS